MNQIKLFIDAILNKNKENKTQIISDLERMEKEIVEFYDNTVKDEIETVEVKEENHKRKN